MLDAICTPEGLVNAAAENNMPAVALTDHGVMYGVMEFYKKARAKGVKPIIGCEVYILTKGSRFQKGKDNSHNIVESGFIDSKDRTNGTEKKKKGGYQHLVLLAKDKKGYDNLVKLISIGHTEGFYYKPRIDTEVLRKYSEGLVALSACAGGVVSTHLVNKDYEQAKDAAITYKEIFGDDFYLEIQNHGMELEKPILAGMPKLSKELGIKLIASNDVHYLKHEHAIAHNIYLYISTDLSRDKEGKNMETDLRYGTDQVYFKSAEQMCELFKDYPEAIESTLEVAGKCNLELPKGVYHMPNFPIPDNSGAKDLDEYLAMLAKEGLRKKIKNVTDTEIQRLNDELEVIKKMQFSGYFLIVADFIKHAKSNNILVGPGRGSAAGSLVCYALGITNVNPLDYNLLFERFLNPDRVSMPDIDIDFQDDKRDDVINYSKQKYGENSVSQIVTFNRLKTKAVLKDVGRVLNYPFDAINEITKHVPSIFGKVKSLEDCYKEIPEFKEYFDEVADRKKLLNYSIVLENLNKNASLHASGVVIAPSDITDYVPISKTPQMENVYMTQYDMKMLEEAGLIKMDFLGLKELKIISQAIELIEKRRGVKIDLDTLPLDDAETYELFSGGYTIGIFQFSRGKMREYLTKLKPKDINDLAAMNALYRPGPMDLIPEFLECKYGRKKVEYLHPKIEPILKETYGVIVYQEQVMQIVRVIAGHSLAKADIVRRAMGKKDEKLMKEQEKEFINGAVKNDIDKKTAKEIFKLILKFADYGFNKSHAVAYSVVAYYTAYLKTHYPLEFMTAQLNCRKDDMDEMVGLINECKRMKIKLSMPNINECFADFTIDDSTEKRILFGLSSIKNVGFNAVEHIANLRTEHGQFVNFADFCARVDPRLANKKTIESLIYAGAFDILDPNRQKLFMNHEHIMSKYGARRSELESGQGNMFGKEQKFSVNQLDDLMHQTEDWNEREKLMHEKSVLGLYLSSHPLADYEEEVNKLSTLHFSDAADLESEKIDLTKNVRMCGIISGTKVKMSKKGNRFCVFNLEDFTGQGECIVFPKTYENFKDRILDDMIVSVYGRAEENGNTFKVIVDEIKPLTPPKPKGNGRELKGVVVNEMIIKIDADNFTAEKLRNVKQIFGNRSGNCIIRFDILKGNNVEKTFELRDIDLNFDTNTAIMLSETFGKNNIIIN